MNRNLLKAFLFELSAVMVAFVIGGLVSNIVFSIFFGILLGVVSAMFVIRRGWV
jgi:preprotein translocase subunit SecF